MRDVVHHLDETPKPEKEGVSMRHLPSIEALTDSDDKRLLAELEICQVLDKLARVRELVDRADNLLATVLTSSDEGEEAPGPDPVRQARFYAAILTSIRKGMRFQF